METALALPTKEAQQTNRQAGAIQAQASLLVIESPDQAEAGANLLTTIKEAKKVITARKEEITRPLMKSLASVRDLFKPAELTLEDAEKNVKAKMLAFNIAENDRIENEKARIAARVEKGTMKAETAIRKIADSSTTKMKTRTITKVRVVDETLIPREWLTPDMKKITEAVLHTDFEIPGIERYQEKIIAA